MRGHECPWDGMTITLSTLRGHHEVTVCLSAREGWGDPSEDDSEEEEELDEEEEEEEEEGQGVPSGEPASREVEQRIGVWS